MEIEFQVHVQTGGMREAIAIAKDIREHAEKFYQ